MPSLKPATARRSCCPVACALDLLGDRWTLLVIRDLMRGVDRFGGFARSPEGIATNILADRLELLMRAGLVERVQRPRRAHPRYRLTNAGWSLEPVLRALAEWGLGHLPGTEAKLAPTALRSPPARSAGRIARPADQPRRR
jgi:DNA-binding HxlR family transcriptional regulator